MTRPLYPGNLLVQCGARHVVRRSDLARARSHNFGWPVAGSGDEVLCVSRSSPAWMDAPPPPLGLQLPEGFTVVDRTQRTGTPHPMRHRNTGDVAARLGEVRGA